MMMMMIAKCGHDDDGSKTNPECAPTRGTRRRDVLLVATTAASVVEHSSLGYVFPPVASA